MDDTSGMEVGHSRCDILGEQDTYKDMKSSIKKKLISQKQSSSYGIPTEEVRWGRAG